MSTDERASRIPKAVWKTAILGGMASYLDGGALVTGGIAMALAMPSLGMTEWDLGILSAMLTGGLAVGALVGGRLGDRFGRKRVFSIDLLILAIGLLINTFAVSTPMLYFGIAITGLAMGADLPVSISLVAEAAPKEHRGKMVSFSQLLWGIGPAVVIILNLVMSNSTLAPELQSRILWAHLAIVAIVVWMLRLRLPESKEWLYAAGGEEALGEDEKVDEALAAVGTVDRAKLRLLVPLMAPLVIVSLFYAISGIGPATGGQFTFFILMSVAHMPPSTISLIMLAIIPLGITLNLLFMKFVDTKYRYPLMIFGGVLSIIAFMVPAVAGISAATYLFALFGNMTGSGFMGEGLYKVRSQEVFPTLVRSTAQGIGIFVARISAAVIAVFTPVLAATNFTLLAWILVACNLVALVLGIMMSKIPNAQEQTVPQVSAAESH